MEGHFVYDDRIVEAAVASCKDILLDLTMNCSREKTLQWLRDIWTAENTKQYKNLAIMWACEEIAAEMKGETCWYRAGR